MKTIFVILMLLISSAVMAHDKVVVIPMAADDLPPCLISGEGIECLAKVRVPINLSVFCSGTGNSANSYIKYTAHGKQIIFQVGLADFPRIHALLEYHYY